jgi:hypothetical protein
MAAIVYLRDGRCIALHDAVTVSQEFHARSYRFVSTLVCRDSVGNVIAEFERDTVLGFRRMSTPKRAALHLIDGDQQPAPLAMGHAAD